MQLARAQGVIKTTKVLTLFMNIFISSSYQYIYKNVFSEWNNLNIQQRTLNVNVTRDQGILDSRDIGRRSNCSPPTLLLSTVYEGSQVTKMVYPSKRLQSQTMYRPDWLGSVPIIDSHSIGREERS